MSSTPEQIDYRNPIFAVWMESNQETQKVFLRWLALHYWAALRSYHTGAEKPKEVKK